jgi:hypothetical protein
MVHCVHTPFQPSLSLSFSILFPLFSIQPGSRPFPPLTLPSPTHSTFNTSNRNNNTSNNTHNGHSQHIGKHELFVEGGIVTFWRACLANACSIPHYHTCSHPCVCSRHSCVCVCSSLVCVYSSLPAFPHPPAPPPQYTSNRSFSRLKTGCTRSSRFCSCSSSSPTPHQATSCQLYPIWPRFISTRDSQRLNTTAKQRGEIRQIATCTQCRHSWRRKAAFLALSHAITITSHHSYLLVCILRVVQWCMCTG